MANKLILKKSSVVAKTPLTTDLEYGELALNYADEKLYFKNAANAIKSFNVTAAAPSALTIGTGLSGGSYDGSAPVTIAIDSSVVTLNGVQSLTNKTFTDGLVVSTNTTTNAVRITQVGTGNALLVEDSANPDASPFVINASGNVIIGATSQDSLLLPTGPLQIIGDNTPANIALARYETGSGQSTSLNFYKANGTKAAPTIALNDDRLGKLTFYGYDGTAFIPGAEIHAEVKGTSAANDMPGSLVFSTTARGTSTLTERMRITTDGNIGIGTVPFGYTRVHLGGMLPSVFSASTAFEIDAYTPSTSTTRSTGVLSAVSTDNASFTLTELSQFKAALISPGTGSTITNHYGFLAEGAVSGVTNDYGFSSNLASGTGKWNFYASGTANNYFAGNVGIGTTTPAAKLDVAADVLINNVRAGRGGNNHFTNTVFGQLALPSTATDTRNTAIGYNTLSQSTTGNRNTAVGTWAMQSTTTGYRSVAVGTGAMFTNITGYLNTAIGDSALYYNTEGNENTAVGHQSLITNTTGSFNSVIGVKSLYSNTGSYNTAIGHSSGYYITTGTKNTIIGRYDGNQLGLDIRTTSNNIVLSDGDGNPRQYYDGTNNAWVWQTAGSEQARIDSAGNVGIGTTTPLSKLHIQNLAGVGETAIINSVTQQTTGNTFFNFDLYSTQIGTSSFLRFRKSRGTVASPTIVANGEINARIGGMAYDGANFIDNALIRFGVDGVPALNDMPGRIEFWTTPTGSATLSERMRIRSDGNIGFGGVGNSSIGFNQQKTITGGTNAYAHAITATISSDVTSTAFGYYTGLSTAVTSFTVGTLRHYTAFQNALGAGSAITNQFGFTAGSSLTGATNNYGFYGDIASGTGRWNFYANGTASNYFGGNVGIGTTSPATLLDVRGNSGVASGGSTPVAIRIGATDQDGGSNTWNTSADFAQLQFHSADASISGGNNIRYTIGAVMEGVAGGTTALAFRSSSSGVLTERMRITSDGKVGVGTTTPQSIFDVSGDGYVLPLFRAYGTSSGNYPTIVKGRGTQASPAAVQSGDELGGLIFQGYDGTSNIPAAYIRANVNGTPGTNDMPGRLVFATTADGASSATERMYIDNAGTVSTPDTGRVQIGTGAEAASALVISRPMTGNVVVWNTYTTSSVQSDVTSQARIYVSNPTTQATTFTLPTLVGFSAQQQAFGAGSTVTNQFGFEATASLTGATNNFGFRSNIASGTGRWNFYASGTANNYFAGSLGIGTTSLSTAVSIGGATSVSLGISISPQGWNSALHRLTVPTSGDTSVWSFNYSGSAVDYSGYATSSISVGNGAILFSTNTTNTAPTERMRLDSAGNLGLGVTPSAWNTARKTIQIGSGGFISVGGTSFVELGTNNYVDTSSVYRYSNNGLAANYRQFSGVHSWFTAPSGTAGAAATLTQVMTLNNAGNLGIGTTAPDANLTVNGVASFAAGTALLPSIARSGDLNTGMWFPAADTIAFSEGGTEVMRLDSAGNVGIGTTAPTQKLDVNGNISLAGNGTSNRYIALLNEGSTYAGTLMLQAGAGSASYGGAVVMYGPLHASYPGAVYIGASATTGSSIVFGRGGNGGPAQSELMRIDSAGNVGIGTTNIGSRLSIRGISATGYNSTFSQSNATVQIISDEMAVNQWYPTFNIATVRQSLSTGSGAFGGIGFSTIDDSNNSGQYDAARIAVINESGNTVLSPTAMAFYTQVGAVSNTNAATERMRITSAGNVGIGTTSPTAPLHIFSATFPLARVERSTTVTNGMRSTLSAIHTTSGDMVDGFGADISFAIRDSAGVDNEIANFGAVRDGADNSGAFELYTKTSGSSTLKMVIKSSGNVGIGTTAPAYKLEVNGSFAATTKSFVIDHPTKPNMKLRYGSLEGPENGVYIRGKLTGNTIELPEYWTKLVDPDSITVTLTPIGRHQKLYVEDIINNTVIVGNESDSEVKCFYVVYGERCDVDKLEVEID